MVHENTDGREVSRANVVFDIFYSVTNTFYLVQKDIFQPLYKVHIFFRCQTSLSDCVAVTDGPGAFARMPFVFYFLPLLPDIILCSWESVCRVHSRAYSSLANVM